MGGKIATAFCAAALLSIPATSFAATWPKTAYRSCGTLWREIGIPEHINAVNRDTTFLCYKRFALRHDNVTRTPEWVIERLKKSQLERDRKRPSKSFVVEHLIPKRGRASSGDYTKPKANLVRGHMAPSEDFRSSLADMKASFVYTNSVPQIGDKFNGATWGTLEDEVRNAVKKRGDVYIITGPVHRIGSGRAHSISAADGGCGNKIDLEGPEEAFICKSHNATPQFCPKGVGVPIGVSKIVYDRAQAQTFAFLMSNAEHPTGLSADQARAHLDKHRVTVAAIESATGLKFFRTLAGEKQAKALHRCETETFWAPRP